MVKDVKLEDVSFHPVCDFYLSPRYIYTYALVPRWLFPVRNIPA